MTVPVERVETLDALEKVLAQIGPRSVSISLARERLPDPDPNKRFRTNYLAHIAYDGGVLALPLAEVRESEDPGNETFDRKRDFLHAARALTGNGHLSLGDDPATLLMLLSDPSFCNEYQSTSLDDTLYVLAGLASCLWRIDPSLRTERRLCADSGARQNIERIGTLPFDRSRILDLQDVLRESSVLFIGYRQQAEPVRVPYGF